MDDHKFFKIQSLDAKTLTYWKARRDKIDFDPSYQRKGRRWSTSDKQYLIDSILNGFDVPKFYMADFTWGSSPLNEKKKTYAVIDGKQRFEAIFDFFDDKFPLSPSFSLLSDPELKLGRKKYSELKKNFPDVAEVFDTFNPVVIGVVTDDIKFVEELFVRLNKNKPLSGAEIRNAMSSPVSQMVRTVSAHRFFTSNVKFSTNKGQDLNCAAKIFMFEALGGLQETKKVTLDRFVLNSGIEHKKAENALPILLETLDDMAELFQFHDPLLASEGQIPVYYWLSRNANEAHAPYIRDFLEDFHTAINSDSDVASKYVGLADVLSYKTASRSVNDKSSHETRYTILAASFKKWIRANI